MTDNTHGGPRPGAGRKPNELPSQRIVVHATPEELAYILDNLTPRDRAIVLMAAADAYPSEN